MIQLLLKVQLHDILVQENMIVKQLITVIMNLKYMIIFLNIHQCLWWVSKIDSIYKIYVMLGRGVILKKIYYFRSYLPFFVFIELIIQLEIIIIKRNSQILNRVWILKKYYFGVYVQSSWSFFQWKGTHFPDLFMRK